MELKRKAIMAAFGLLAAGLVSSSALADTRFEPHHPRQEQVLDRVAHQRHEIHADRRDGDLSPAGAHRLMARENRIAREDRHMARVNGGYITRGQERMLNHQEDRPQRRLPG